MFTDWSILGDKCSIFGGKLSIFGLSDHSGEHSVHCVKSTKTTLPPFLAMPRFSRRLLQHSLPKGPVAELGAVKILALPKWWNVDIDCGYIGIFLNIYKILTLFVRISITTKYWSTFFVNIDIGIDIDREILKISILVSILIRTILEISISI